MRLKKFHNLEVEVDKQHLENLGALELGHDLDSCELDQKAIYKFCILLIFYMKMHKAITRL